MLWIDKHCPKQLYELNSHREVNELLTKLVEKSHGELPHLLFYGPSGAGKKTRIMATLRAVFGAAIDRVKTEVVSNVDTSNNVIVCQSDHHIHSESTVEQLHHRAVPCTELGSKDRVIIQDVIKNLSASPSASNYFLKGPAYRVFLFEDADSLSLPAQAALRRTMETYIRNARMFLHVKQLSRIILPLRSRCLCIRVGSHTIAEIVDVLRGIAKAEGLPPKQSSDEVLRSIANASGRNLRRAILTLETMALGGFPAAPGEFLMPWELQVAKLVKSVLENQSPSTISALRPQVYELLVCCIPGEVVLEKFVTMLSQRVKPELVPKLIHVAAHFSHTMQQGSRQIWHIEACIVQFMALLAGKGADV
ncbi:replication factor C 38 kDa subunit, putative [Babesia bigemina]|uniref:Replication factor C 38 kDa subunit, putative n=1 Tax=Babesia bigemina TaxID=5866 RepID=A0A061D452_BABBI|nr:replication factor C 38 kDa subunit, putative [Babesia bigemina]CDR94812.1 replication factor C 38 kDa subunit, putative [Babesia bigemina]|eukprot:XP_012766998.1 replication factor C 38 kDa subunit, putative [Babesia bigemina]